MTMTKPKRAKRVASSRYEDGISFLYHTLHLHGVPCYVKFQVNWQVAFHDLYVDRKFLFKARLLINRVLNGGINYSDIDRIMPFVYTQN